MLPIKLAHAFTQWVACAFSHSESAAMRRPVATRRRLKAYRFVEHALHRHGGSLCTLMGKAFGRVETYWTLPVFRENITPIKDLPTSRGPLCPLEL